MANEYALPDEMLDVACSTIETSLQTPVLMKAFDPSQVGVLRTALSQFRNLHKLIPFNDALVTNAELIERNPEWLNVRMIAQQIVAASGFDIQKWEKENL